MNADLLIQHSIYCVYPLWMKHLQKHRGRFQKVILYPSDHNREVSFKDYLYETIQETWVKDHTIDWTTPGIDWRQAETEPMLPLSDTEWIYFTEPDWIVKDYVNFYDKVEEAMKDADVIGWLNPTNFPYIHPSCFFIKREVLEKTQKDFRAHPEINGCDHFAMITADVKKLGGKIVSLQDLGFNCDVSPDADCFHLGGLTSNYIDGILNPSFEFHRPEIFAVYNYECRNLGLNLPEKFLELSQDIEQILLSRVDVSLRNNQWTKFFRI